MSGVYDVWVCDVRGYRLQNVGNWLALEFALVANNYSAFSITLPGDSYRDYLVPDAVFEFWRDGRLLTAGFARTFDVATDEGNAKTRVVGGYDGNYLLTSRIINYYAGSTYAQKTDQADDMMKAIVRENLGASSTDTARDLSSFGLVVSGDVSAAPSITRAFAYDNVLETLQSLATNSREAGAGLYFGITPYATTGNRIGWRFSTAINQPGQDRRMGQIDNAVIFSDQNGRIQSPHYTEDYTDEATVAVGGGQNPGADRDIQTATSTFVNRSPWARREIFVDARQEDTSAGVLDKAEAELNARRGRFSFGCTIPNTPASRYGIDWDFGDRITIDYDNRQFDAIIKTVRFAASPAGETIAGEVEID